MIKLKDILLEDYTIALARAYHVAMDQKDYDELGRKIDRNKFKRYFRIPRDADEDPNYKRDPKFNIKKLTQINEAYPWFKLDMTRKERDFFDEMEYKIERMQPENSGPKQINSFIVSVIDVYSQPQNDMSDIMSKYGMDDILKHVQRTGLKPLKRAV